ncbi:MAG: hypothetical protein GX046_06270, partial [Tissierellia bacterium]|nr:hypothetical protein [Tissierellia bacterium]
MKRKLLSLFLSILLITSNLASFADTPEIQDSGEGVVKQLKEVTELAYEFESEEVTELAPESGLLVESELQPESGSKLSPEPEPEPELEPEAELEPELET